MSEHQDLRVFGDALHALERQGIDDAAEQTVEEAGRHGGEDHRSDHAWSSRRSRCWTLQAPSGFRVGLSRQGPTSNRAAPQGRGAAGSGICPQAASCDCLPASQRADRGIDAPTRSGLGWSGNQAERAALRIQEHSPTVAAGLKFGHRGAQFQRRGLGLGEILDT